MKHIKRLTAALALAGLLSVSSAEASPFRGLEGWWLWCETDAYTNQRFCAWIKGNPENPGKGRKPVKEKKK